MRLLKMVAILAALLLALPGCGGNGEVTIPDDAPPLPTEDPGGHEGAEGETAPELDVNKLKNRGR